MSVRGERDKSGAALAASSGPIDLYPYIRHGLYRFVVRTCTWVLEHVLYRQPACVLVFVVCAGPNLSHNRSHARSHIEGSRSWFDIALCSWATPLPSISRKSIFRSPSHVAQVTATNVYETAFTEASLARAYAHVSAHVPPHGPRARSFSAIPHSRAVVLVHEWPASPPPPSEALGLVCFRPQPPPADSSARL